MRPCRMIFWTPSKGADPAAVARHPPVLIWALGDPDRLTPQVRALLEDPDQEILFSVASIWEISIKAALGRTDFKVTPRDILEAAQRDGFVELPVRSAAALAPSRTFPCCIATPSTACWSPRP